MFSKINLKYFLLASIFFISTHASAKINCEVFFTDMASNFNESFLSTNNEAFLEEKNLAETGLINYKNSSKERRKKADDLCRDYIPGSGINHVNHFLLTMATDALEENN